MKRTSVLLASICLAALLACTNPFNTNPAPEATAANPSADTLPATNTASQEQQADNTRPDSTHSSALMLESFTAVPTEIQGCGCYFSADEAAYKRHAYVFAAGYDSVAFITIRQQRVRLKLVSSTRQPATFGDYDHVEVYTGGPYKVTVDIKYKKSSGDETWQNKGTLMVETKEGQKRRQTFFGECGC